MVKRSCVRRKVNTVPLAAKKIGIAKKHIGVLGSRKTKNLPFTK
jgi:hypothetical protein